MPAPSLSANPLPARPTLPARPAVLPLPFGARLRQLARLLASFEASFAFFLFSNQIEILVGTDFNITIVAYALSIGAGAVVVFRHGIYARGLPSACLGLVFVLWCALSFTWTPSRLAAPPRLFELLVFVTWAVLAPTLIIARSPERVTRFLVMVLAFASLLALVGAQIYLLYGGFRRLEQWGEVGRVYLSWGRGIGSGAVLAFLIAVYARPLSLRQILATAMFGLSAFFLLVGGGRGPFLATCAGCLVPLALGTPLPRGRLILPRSQVITLSLILVAVVGVIFLLTSGLAVDTVRRLGSLVDQLGEDDRISIGTDRFDKFSRAIYAWWQAPLAGGGIGSFSMISLGRENRGGDYPHNFILEVLSEYGLIGLTLFGLYAWSVCRWLNIARLRREPLLLAGLMLFTVGWFNAMTSAEITNNLAVFWGLALLTMRGPGGRQADPPRRRVRPKPAAP